MVFYITFTIFKISIHQEMFSVFNPHRLILKFSLTLWASKSNSSSVAFPLIPFSRIVHNMIYRVSLKKGNFSDFRLISVLEVGFYFFTCALELEFRARFILSLK